jgi:polysaccharide biosynthesis protein PslH
MATVISLISYPFLPAKVGGQKGIALFNKYFCRYVALICVTTQRNDPSAAEGYEVLNILSNSPFRYVNPLHYFTLRKIVRQRKASHLILEHPYFGWLGVLIKWTCSTKLVVHSHNIEGLRWRSLNKWWWAILWAYERFTHRQADYNFFIHDQDRQYGIDHFRLDPSKCLTMTYGIEWDHSPPEEEASLARETLRSRYAISPGEKILLFNGAFDYQPNLAALQAIVHLINPLLLRKEGFLYKIILCGRGIPQAISQANHANIIFAGFVDDMDQYYKGANVFLNPIVEGGGIKTKLVEALGNNLNAVSTQHGALGIDPNLCQGKLQLCRDGDWSTFADLVVAASSYEADIPRAYFEHFYWGRSTQRAAEFIQGQ